MTIDTSFTISTSYSSSVTSADLGHFAREINDLNQQIQELTTWMARQALERDDGQDCGPVKKGGGRSAGNAPGWLMAIAQVLGEKLDKLSNDMVRLSKQVDEKEPSTLTEFQVVSQQFSMLMNTASTAIKSIGEGMLAMARKQ
jgi:flagellar biosynthesis chaperone FliJ